MNLQELRDLVWGEDIASPTCPEYREHHESIQKILKAIDSMMPPKTEYTEFERAGFSKPICDALELLYQKSYGQGITRSMLIQVVRGIPDVKV